jgi:predicted dehydrogenase
VKRSLWLIGCGLIAQEYSKILSDLGVEHKVIGRGEDSANNFFENTRIKPWTGGVKSALLQMEAPEVAIVAVGVESLVDVSMQLLESGAKKLLIEKPGALNLEGLRLIKNIASVRLAKIYIAYNRRYFSSVLAAQKMVDADGGIISLNYEFTEWSHEIQNLVKPPGVKESWLLNNSSHVLDLAFFFGGRPLDWNSWTHGELEWHPSAARFVGAGITEKNIVFSYFSDWQGPGRWGLELVTRRRRLIFRPMETLQEIKIGSIGLKCVEIDDELDKKYKPGYFRQICAFLDDDDRLLCSIDEQIQNANFYKKIANYI